MKSMMSVLKPVGEISMPRYSVVLMSEILNPFLTLVKSIGFRSMVPAMATA